MSRFIVTPSQKKALGIAAIVALLVVCLLLKSYFILLVFTAILAFLYTPIYKKLLNRWSNTSKASIATLLIMIITIAIPVILLALISVNQVNNFLSSYDWSSVGSSEESLIATINNAFTKLGIDKQLDANAISKAIQDTLKAYSQELVQSIPDIFSSIFGLITSSIIFIYVFLSMLRNQDKLIESSGNLNPLGTEISNYLLSKIAAMTKAMVKGQFIIAAMQGFTSAALLTIAGMPPELFFFWFILLTTFSFIPMGAGIITIPIGVVMILTGDVWQGIVVIAGHLLITTNIDNVMRPRLVPKEAKLDPALTILSVFAGVALFGFLGIVIGPVIMIVVVTTLKVFLDVYRNMTVVEEKRKPKKPTIFGRVKGGIKKLQDSI
jgi:predicted PurR-regulated permease PerM